MTKKLVTPNATGAKRGQRHKMVGARLQTTELIRRQVESR